ncbi:ferredoxin [Halieaceae bacterium IMCC14734]|uniref:Ferredoxin n=1 Tax=Candidatus Litorirhabdus singularis TaxID=2518993 RepID=A0ABT3THA5_9GAMM|nr:ferredoxin [Candidatus Litorirhabdus singularis]MCX2981703.1 ferredoxin [Candidatus Litorirhabdus singularis]
MTKYRVKVDLMLCQGHGVCTEECPEVFKVIDMGTGYPKVSLTTENPAEELRSKVQDAVDYCPNRTLSIVEID